MVGAPHSVGQAGAAKMIALKLGALAQGIADVVAPVVYSRARDLAMAFLVAILVLLLVLSPVLARYSRRPAVVLGPAIYFGVLHLIALIGLATSVRFETGLAQLTLFTFPFSIVLYQETALPGFASGHELADNYVRYIVHFGGWNALIFATFLALVVPPRVRREPRHSAQAPLPS